MAAQEEQHRAGQGRAGQRSKSAMRSLWTLVCFAGKTSLANKVRYRITKLPKYLLFCYKRCPPTASSCAFAAIDSCAIRAPSAWRVSSKARCDIARAVLCAAACSTAASFVLVLLLLLC